MWRKFFRFLVWHFVPAWHIEAVVKDDGVRMPGVNYPPRIIFGWTPLVDRGGERGTFLAYSSDHEVLRFATPWGARRYAAKHNL